MRKEEVKKVEGCGYGYGCGSLKREDKACLRGEEG
jgi:hypothetical protein